MFPSGYTKYASSCKENGENPNVLLARYATRYKMAGQLNGIQLLAHSEIAEVLYLHAIRISFAYSALESLEKYLKMKVSLKNIELASHIRRDYLKANKFLLTQSDTKLRNSLDKFLGSKNDSDLKPFVVALRHSMFHGQFNPSASGLNSVSGIALLNDIEKLLFTSMDKTSYPVFIDLCRLGS